MSYAKKAKREMPDTRSAHEILVSELVNLAVSNYQKEWSLQVVNHLTNIFLNNYQKLIELRQVLVEKSERSDCIPLSNKIQHPPHITAQRINLHGVCYKIWRWPNLQSHFQIGSLRCCQYPYAESEFICVNPYHYSILPNVPLEPVQIMRLRHFPSVPENYRHLLNDGTAAAAPVQDDSQPLDMSVNRARAEAAPPPVLYKNYMLENRELLSVIMQLDQDPILAAASILNLHKEMRIVDYEEPTHWGTVNYYEFNLPVGPVYYCKAPITVVDGCTDSTPYADRVCLGSLPSPHRSPVIDEAMRDIGLGIHLHYVNHRLTVENKSTKEFYLQSSNFNHANKLYRTTVARLSPGACLEIFNMRIFCMYFNKCILEGFDAFPEIMDMCIIKISFDKGWGRDYERKDENKNPCWIKINMNGALLWFNNALRKMFF